jgi:hypothetical protein
MDIHAARLLRADSSLVWASAITGVTTNTADRKATILISLITISSNSPDRSIIKSHAKLTAALHQAVLAKKVADLVVERRILAGLEVAMPAARNSQ